MNYEIIDFVDLEDGWYGECHFYVTDNASNRSESHKLGDFVLDRSPPQGTIEANIGRYTNNQKPHFVLRSNEEIIFQDFVDCNQELIDRISDVQSDFIARKNLNDEISELIDDWKTEKQSFKKITQQNYEINSFILDNSGTRHFRGERIIRY